MGKKLMGWKTKGMNRDLSVSAFNPEFAFENYNLRLSTKEGNTTLSWVNERGPAEIELVNGTWEGETVVTGLIGTPIGTAILNHQLVLFTCDPGGNDYIYKLKYYDSDGHKMICALLYSYSLGFDLEHPLETMVYYEAEYIQKVYWVDGKNQPRLININASASQRAHWQNNSTCFDFAPAVNLNETLSVTKQQGAGGLFAPGVIQYCFTYVNRYGQQTNIINVSPLEYLCHNDRGASPEEKVTCNCKIEISNLDTTFDFVRLYSIQRTSLDLDPIVKILEDIDIPSSAQIEYTDNGTTGAIIDPYELLYVGGKEIIANTMEDKDSTLFLGNLTQLHTNVNDIQDWFIKHPQSIAFTETKAYQIPSPSGTYSYYNSLQRSSKLISTFKGGENYRFGFQLQKVTGEWSEPIFINDGINSRYPYLGSSVNAAYAARVGMNRARAAVSNSTINLSVPSVTLNLSEAGVDTSVYKRVRPLVVYPSIGDRRVLCQGVLNPTVFNALDRIDNSPYTQASWFFRPNCKYDEKPGVIKDGEYKYTTWWSGNFEGSNEEAFYRSYVGVNSLNTKPQDQIYFEKNVMPIYVFIGIVEDDVAYNILRRRYVNARRMVSGKHRWEKIEFWGGAIIEDYSSADATRKVLTLLKTTPWEQEQEEDEEGNYFHYDDDWTYERAVNKTFYIYKKIQVATNGILYYVKPGGHGEGDFDYFWFNFKDDADEAGVHGHIYHRIKFQSTLSDTSGMAEDATTLDTSDGGSILRFKHYDSLYTLEDAIVKNPENPDLDTDIIDPATQIEIQGSVKNYKTPFIDTEDNDCKVNSNTQFFIDQSIVTLNSPDIEFDTEVQTYGTEGLSLKIVGAIPISANVSFHDSAISSAMVEEMHNWGHNQYDIVFGTGKRNHNITHAIGSNDAGKRLVSDYLWNDVIVRKNADYEDGFETLDLTCNYLVYPWQRKGSMNNDYRTADEASSMLSTKKESTLLFSSNTQYIGSVWDKKVEAQIVLTENSEVINTRLGVQGGINYYANVDKLLYNEKGYKIITDNNILNSSLQMDITSENSGGTIVSGGTPYDAEELIGKVFSPIPMRYKSTSHAVIGTVKDSNNAFPILPCSTYVSKSTNLGGTTYWDKVLKNFSQERIDNYDGTCFLWLGELVKNTDSSYMPFGGKTKEAIKANKWIVGGESVPIGNNGSVTLRWTEGDTYYQRYDCLKTYAYTPEDVNQVVEILSFMCETHVNIDGRYDRNRGQIDNTNMRPDIFNALNTVYSQKNNFFISQKTGLDDRDTLHYPNHITFTKTKTSGADVDLYTNVTLASTMEMDGDKGEITSLNRFNNQLIVFQDTGIANLLYNENMMLSTDKGIPVEIGNSGKVTGKNYISNTVGCSNKWSICQTPSGIYFIDSSDKNIYLFNGQLQSLSTAKGFNSWASQNIPDVNVKWNPKYFDNFVTYYDKQNQDVLFINEDTCLAYSEKLGVFTSFYSYEGVPFFCNLDDTGIWLNSSGLFQHQAGDYGKFFGNNKPYWTILVGNPEPQTDKIFTNLEFRACVDGEGNINQTGKFTPTLPFDYLETWNEYQHGLAKLQWKNGHGPQLHHLRDNTAHLDRKFRIWRCDIPRDNYGGSGNVFDGTFDTTFKGAARHGRPIDRMRNPWLYLKLKKEAAEEEHSLHKAEIHDLVMTYFS